ncbi:hypothetical protein HOI18_02045 [Candidatus Uhrbacteria bacterium]|jgi:hypothetical protein|nr:hypothetical protein [Candidatus Uhrbacteria bacterium]
MIAIKRLGFGLFVGLDLWISLCLAALALFMNRVSDFPIQTDAAMLVFFSTLVVYNLDHIRDGAYVSGLHKIFRLITILIASGMTIRLVHIAPVAAQVCFLIYFLVGCVYSMPLGKGQTKTVRELVGRLKAVLVASAIMIAAAGLPICWYGSVPSVSYFLITMFIFQLVLIAVMFFDVIDEEGCADPKLGSEDFVFTMPHLVIISLFCAVIAKGLLMQSLIGAEIMAFSAAMFVQLVICVLFTQTEQDDHRTLGRFLTDGVLCAPLCAHLLLV